MYVGCACFAPVFLVLRKDNQSISQFVFGMGVSLLFFDCLRKDNEILNCIFENGIDVFICLFQKT